MEDSCVVRCLHPAGGSITFHLVMDSEELMMNYCHAVAWGGGAKCLSKVSALRVRICENLIHTQMPRTFLSAGFILYTDNISLGNLTIISYN